MTDADQKKVEQFAARSLQSPDVARYEFHLTARVLSTVPRRCAPLDVSPSITMADQTR
jgi:hypothetical protein